jgi:type I restriction enzyme R subunit
MGFTGTPLVAGEELTRREFGDYVSVYNFRDAIEDGATVPLFYENRIPELQRVNEAFADELTALLEEAELDQDAEGRLTRRFGRQYALITRPERLRTVARDLVRHFIGRGFIGKAMYVGVDRPPRSGCTSLCKRRGRSTWVSCGPSTMRCPSWSGRGWPAASS